MRGTRAGAAHPKPTGWGASSSGAPEAGEPGPQGEPDADGAPGSAPDLSAYATKAYVDQEIEGLDDLSEMEF